MKRRCVDEGRKEGRKEGRIEGRKEGREDTLRGIVARLRKMKKSDHEICHLLGVPEETVQQIELSVQS